MMCTKASTVAIAERQNAPKWYALPEGWTWQRVAEERDKWGTTEGRYPLACAPGVVAWGVPLCRCSQCLRRCQSHNQTQCLCVKHDGQCDMGHCIARGSTAFAYRDERNHIAEVRVFCSRHATDPEYGWLRAGGERVGTR